jgi:glycerol dehydrogenase-like iron-containing ADH family enzyme
MSKYTSVGQGFIMVIVPAVASPDAPSSGTKSSAFQVRAWGRPFTWTAESSTEEGAPSG